MARTLRLAAAVAVMTALTGAPGGARPMEERPLPEFQVVSLDGAPTASAQLAGTGPWLLIYVTPTSAASARLLTAMKAWESSAMAQRVVVVVGAPLEAARALVAQKASAYPNVRWVADPDNSAWKALRLTGTPYLLGIKGTTITWALAGVLNDPASLESVIRSWVERG